MIVSENTKTLNFKIGYDFSTVQVLIVNETTKKVVYNKSKTVNNVSYYNSITDNQGFNFADQNNYIIELTGELSLLLTNNLKKRVSADSGTFEAKQCLIELLNAINSNVVYRATVYCFNELPNNYRKGNRINTKNEYITL